MLPYRINANIEGAYPTKQAIETTALLIFRGIPTFSIGAKNTAL